MVLIKLSAHHKIVAMGMVILLMVACFPRFTEGNNGEVNKSDVTRAATMVIQSYASETRDECMDTTETTPVKDTTSEIQTEQKKVMSEGETEPEIQSEPAEEVVYIQHYTQQDAIDIAKVLYNECRGVESVTEQACVAWTILNRVDYSDSSIYSVIRSPNQFAFSSDTPIWDNLLELAIDVLERWNRERNGEINVGRVLPPEFRWFEGRNGHNYFRDAYDGDYNIWGYFLGSPYKS